MDEPARKRPRLADQGDDGGGAETKVKTESESKSESKSKPKSKNKNKSKKTETEKKKKTPRPRKARRKPLDTDKSDDEMNTVEDDENQDEGIRHRKEELESILSAESSLCASTASASAAPLGSVNRMQQNRELLNPGMPSDDIVSATTGLSLDSLGGAPGSGPVAPYRAPSVTNVIPVAAPRKTNQLELDPHQMRAVAMCMTGANVLVLGASGTGLTHTARATALVLKTLGYRVVCLSPNDVTAQLVDGVTVHRYLGLRLAKKNIVDLIKDTLNSEELCKRWKSIDTMIIDSAMAMDKTLFSHLDALAQAARNKPGLFFGGVQLCLFMDPFGPGPVPASDFLLFDSKVWANAMFQCTELLINHRYTDEYFKMLGQVRRGGHRMTRSVKEAFMERKMKPVPNDGIWAPIVCASVRAAEKKNEKYMLSLQCQKKVVMDSWLQWTDKYAATRPTEASLAAATSAASASAVASTKSVSVEKKQKSKKKKQKGNDSDSDDEEDSEKEESDNENEENAWEKERKIQSVMDSGAPLTVEQVRKLFKTSDTMLHKRMPGGKKRLELRKGTVVMTTVRYLEFPAGVFGVVDGFSTDGYPLIKFPTRTCEVKHVTMRRFEPIFGEVKCVRIPLMPAFSVPLHQLTGRCIKRAILSINTKSLHKYGQVYHALSRIQCLEGVYLARVDFSCIQPHPMVVDFESKCSRHTDETLKNSPDYHRELKKLRSLLNMGITLPPCILAPVEGIPADTGGVVPETEWKQLDAAKASKKSKPTQHRSKRVASDSDSDGDDKSDEDDEGTVWEPMEEKSGSGSKKEKKKSRDAE